ncbi:methyltransferase [Vandammella animalimorsus]|uniref:Methyltransferase n=2 Tax=Vandammella animalimorsus TaxID=2029117 RepID=A0A2A2T5B5_9BURK|nr:methyltransferase [Vandammella animalimorsus]PAX16681.1 methyltransferase [Vandammella animalimorsus]PAX19311.1 methyltransferase [Vandammella animalimorsus]
MPMRVHLQAVPETMLWTLHNRASESLRGDAFFRDPHAERIYAAIDYPFERHFGPPDSSHAARAQAFDDVIGDWLQEYPTGTVVELGCGLETQCLRLDNGQVRWLAIDTPEAIALREHFIVPGSSAAPRLEHWRGDACNPAWMELVDAQEPVFISAQGMLMYLSEQQVQRLLQAVAARFSTGAAPLQLMFDVVPPWVAALTQSPGGLWKTSHYRVPAMRWGIGASAVPAQIRQWLGPGAQVRWIGYSHYRAWPAWYLQWLRAWPWARDNMPGMVHVTLQS